MATEKRVALVTGANRGLGLGVVRQLAERGLSVILTARDREQSEAAVRQLADEELRVVGKQLDVTSPQSIAQLADEDARDFVRLDVLINNAGILYDHWQRASTADMKTAHEALETNLFGAWRVAQALMPLLKQSDAGRIVNVSSESGSLAGMDGTTPAYSVSKAALNALTRCLAAELADTRILVNSVCPGWVATEMGGPDAPRSIIEGAASIVWAATLPPNGPTGGFYRDGEPLPW